MKNALLLFLGLFLAGCASIFSDNQYSVSLVSNPVGAEYTLSNRQGIVIAQGQTPETLVLRSSDGFFRAARYTLNLRKEGYRDQAFKLKAGISPWYFGNVILGGAIGMLLLDPATGSMWSLPEISEMKLAIAEGAQPAQRTASKPPQTMLNSNLARKNTASNEVDVSNVDLYSELTAANASSQAYVRPPEPQAPLPEVTPASDTLDRSEPKAVYTPQAVSSVDARDSRSVNQLQGREPRMEPQPVAIASNSNEGGSVVAAQRMALAHGCEESIVLDYQTAGGSIYMASCQHGKIRKILCQANSCRIMD